MILGPRRFGARETALTAILQSSRILLVRHGQTAWNIERRFLGRTDIPLDATGLEQAARLGRRFAGTRIDAVWSSPLARARQTAAPLGGACPAPVRVDDALVEIHMGALEGLSGADFVARWPDIAAAWRTEPHAVALPGGERIAEVQERGLDAFARITRTVGPGETVVVVTHQILLATLVCHLRGAPIRDFRSYMHRNTGVTTVELGETPTIVGFDDAAHLEG